MSTVKRVKEGPIICCDRDRCRSLLRHPSVDRQRAGQQAVVPKAASAPVLPDTPMAATNAVAQLPLLAATPAGKGTDVRMIVWAWNAQMGILYANGGADTTQGSLMAATASTCTSRARTTPARWKRSWWRWRSGMKGGTDSKDGVHFITLMGAAPLLVRGRRRAPEEGLRDCTAEVVGVPGYSRGEDKFMGQADWEQNPRGAQGALIVGVLRDGDWKIARVGRRQQRPEQPRREDVGSGRAQLDGGRRLHRGGEEVRRWRV